MFRTLFVVGLILAGSVISLRGSFYSLLFYLWLAYFRPESWLWSDFVTSLKLSLLVGTYTTSPKAAHYRAIDPTRLVDTRIGLGSVKGRVATYAGALGVVPASAPVALSAVPSQARGLMVSMIAVDPLGLGWGLISPCPGQANNANPSSTLNFAPGDVVANSSIVQRGPGGVCTYAISPGYHVVDLVGWFE